MASEKIKYSKVTERAIEELGFSPEDAKELMNQHKEEVEDDEVEQ